MRSYAPWYDPRVCLCSNQAAPSALSRSNLSGPAMAEMGVVATAGRCLPPSKAELPGMQWLANAMADNRTGLKEHNPDASRVTPPDLPPLLLAARRPQLQLRLPAAAAARPVLLLLLLLLLVLLLLCLCKEGRKGRVPRACVLRRTCPLARCPFGAGRSDTVLGAWRGH